jgi:hypothetical protein
MVKARAGPAARIVTSRAIARKAGGEVFGVARSAVLGVMTPDARREFAAEGQLALCPGSVTLFARNGGMSTRKRKRRQLVHAPHLRIIEKAPLGVAAGTGCSQFALVNIAVT